MRYVRKDRRIYDFSLCKLCGTGWGGSGECGRTVCLACGSPQCMSNGLGHGACGVCYHGILPGWSGWECKCGYKDCGVQAVARIGGRPSQVCAYHLERRKPGYVAARLIEREKNWMQIPDGHPSDAERPAV